MDKKRIINIVKKSIEWGLTIFVGFLIFVILEKFVSKFIDWAYTKHFNMTLIILIILFFIGIYLIYLYKRKV